MQSHKNSMMRCFIITLLLAATASTQNHPDATPLQTGPANGMSQGPYHFVKEILIGGTETSWGCLAIDPAAHRLYVSQHTRVVVIDTLRDQVVGEISDPEGDPHFIAVVPELGHGFIGNSLTGNVTVFDLKTLRIVTKIATGGKDPYGIIYESRRGELYVFNAHSPTATVINARTFVVLATIPLPEGEAEIPALDPSAHRIYVNIERKNGVVAVIDTKTRKLTATWPTDPGSNPGGMAIDLKHHLIFSSCSELLVAIDTTTGRVVATAPTAKGAGDAAFDPKTELVFSSNSSGTITLAREQGPGKLTVIQTIPTARASSLMALDPVTHLVYVSAVDKEAPLAGDAQPKRLKNKPGTFKVLVYAAG
jgi:DNA-binding beta-propeller fold protein YncE